MTEIWLPVVGFEGAYEVSNLGRVRSIDRSWSQLSKAGTFYTHRKLGRTLAPGPKGSGHMTVVLGRGKTRQVHALVLEAFVGPRAPGQECRHLDGNETNNRLDNLVWGSRSANTRDKKWHKKVSSAKLTVEQVAEIKAALQSPYYGIGAALAAEYAVSTSLICNIRKNRVHIDV